jgi:hypothetical protein
MNSRVSQKEDPRPERIAKCVPLVQGGGMLYAPSLSEPLLACCSSHSSLISLGVIPGIYESMVKHERKRKMLSFLDNICLLPIAVLWSDSTT